MQMRPILPARVADGRNLFPAPHILMWLDQHRLDMRVIGLHVAPPAILFVSVQNDDDIAPARPAFTRLENPAIGDREDRIAEIAILAADAVQVVTQMAVLGKWLRIIRESA